MKLPIVAIFATLDGEHPFMGTPSVFVRTGGCNLRCWKSTGFCDSPHTLDMTHPYDKWETHDIVNRVASFGEGYKKITITGGEPLLHMEEVKELIQDAKRYKYTSSIETSGSIPLDSYFDSDERERLGDTLIVDLKCPSTEMSKKMIPQAFLPLMPHDVIKLVVENEEDITWGIKFLQLLFKLKCKTTLYYHPPKVAIGLRWGFQNPDWLIQQVLKVQIALPIAKVMANFQTHKYLWPAAVGEPVQDLKLITPEMRKKMIDKEV